VHGDHGAERLADERARGIRREEVALIGNVVDVDVDPPVLGVVTEREICNEIGRDRVHVCDVAVAFPLVVQSAADVEARDSRDREQVARPKIGEDGGNALG
jgi:hypothetical protein